MNTDKYSAQHAGWLLACSSDVNNAKGERELALLDEAGKAVAAAYRDECLLDYAAEDAN